MTACCNFIQGHGKSIGSRVRCSMASVPTSIVTGSDASVMRDVRVSMRSIR
jgi:hypothetical protein